MNMDAIVIVVTGLAVMGRAEVVDRSGIRMIMVVMMVMMRMRFIAVIV
jgi:hypothetical protein